MSQIFSFFLKSNVFENVKKYTKALDFWKVISEDKILIWLKLFQLLYLHLWQTAHCTLHAAQCTLRTAPAPANAPEYKHIHFILHIEHCTLHTTCLYCNLQMYNFTLQTSKKNPKIYMTKCTLIYWFHNVPWNFRSQ